MSEEKPLRGKKVILTVVHICFMVFFVAGISIMYLNSNYGKGISWVYDESYEDSAQFSDQLAMDIDNIFAYVGYRDVFETEGSPNLKKPIVGVRAEDGRERVYTAEQIVRYAKTRGYYLDENYKIAGSPVSMDDEDEEVTVDWRSYNPNLQFEDPADISMTMEELSLDVLGYLGDYYFIYYNYIARPTNLYFKIVYNNDKGKVGRVYTNVGEMTMDEIKALGKYVYVPGNSIMMDNNIKDVPGNIASQLQSYDPYENDNYYMIVAVNTSYPYEDSYAVEAHRYQSMRTHFLLGMSLLCIGMVGCIATLAALTVLSGHKSQKQGEIWLYPADETYTEVGVLIGILLMLILAYSGRFAGYRLISLFFPEDQWPFWHKMTYAVAFYTGLMICGFSGIRRYKARTLWKNSLIYASIERWKRFSIGITYTVGLALGYLAFLALNISLICSMMPFYHRWELDISFKLMFLILLVVFAAINFLVFYYLIKKAGQRDKINEAILNLSQLVMLGDSSFQVDVESLTGKEREMAKHINSISSGLERALREKVKSERLKADLITNVSHDIKTPLTSIINYVDLLKRERIQDPKITQYLEVLDQKSQRLKTLTEDLVEASKASSGNIKLDIEVIDFVELVQQTNGEFEEKLELRKLELVSKLPSEVMLIEADGRRLWRVLENLYNNACKYAMEGSRVYVDMAKEDGWAVFSIKNVSERPLNISPDELTERFVRGDVSRATEGSGLGLSIAKSLTQLQSGVFEIVIDGDLYKALVKFPVRTEDAKSGKTDV